MTAILQWSALAICGAVALARSPTPSRAATAPSLAPSSSRLCDPAEHRWPVPGGRRVAWERQLRKPHLEVSRIRGGGLGRLPHRESLRRRERRPPRSGPLGLAVLGAIAVATAVPFLLADTAGSSTGLNGLPLRSAANAQLIGLYATAGRVYPAFVAACLVPATLRAVRGRFPAAIRIGAGLLSFGYAATDCCAPCFRSCARLVRGPGEYQLHRRAWPKHWPDGHLAGAGRGRPPAAGEGGGKNPGTPGVINEDSA